QTQRLPDDDVDWQRLAFGMGFSVRADFEEQLARYRRQVRRHFANVIADTEANPTGAASVNHELGDLWQGRLDEAQASTLLASIGISDEQDVLNELAQFRDSRAVANMQAVARDRLDRLMPQLLEVLAYQGQGAATLRRLLAFLEAVLRRSAYIVLLVENPSALTQLVKLSAASPFIADRLTQYPVLLD